MSAPRMAQLICDKVEVICPVCGCSQPNSIGEDDWKLKDFQKLAKEATQIKPCVACDEPLLIAHNPQAQFRT